MNRANAIRGRIEEHGLGIGTSNEEAVQERAQEIALTNGRRAEQVTQTDLEQARQELEAAQSGPESGVEEPDEQSGPWENPAGVTQSAPTKVPTDEQTLPDELVKEGLDEATHERMVEGNQESRRRDSAFEDQLPGAETLEDE